MKKIRPIRLAKALIFRFLPYNNRFCPICKHRLGRFLPYFRIESSRLMTVLGGVGSNLKDFECPWCGCHDRERHLFLYLSTMDLWPKLNTMAVLHFAPEKRLSPLIASHSPKRYIRCDLFPQAADVMKVDMLNMPYDDATFDLLIANHVLEHVSDDVKALDEIARVLKPGGLAILQTPYSSKLHNTWEDEGIDTDEARLEAHGQEDHVRLYGRDIFERFSSSGLIAKVATHTELLADSDPVRYGVNPEEPLFLYQKPL